MMNSIHNEIMMWRKHIAECREQDADYINRD